MRIVVGAGEGTLDAVNLAASTSESSSSSSSSTDGSTDDDDVPLKRTSNRDRWRSAASAAPAVAKTFLAEGSAGRRECERRGRGRVGARVGGGGAVQKPQHGTEHTEQKTQAEFTLWAVPAPNPPTVHGLRRYCLGDRNTVRNIQSYTTTAVTRGHRVPPNERLV